MPNSGWTILQRLLLENIDRRQTRTAMFERTDKRAGLNQAGPARVHAC